ncbi:hypothetical protein V6N13_088841 [Hibiscus sabdariffa]
MVFRNTRIGEFETTVATEACLAMMHNKVPAKKTNPGSFTIPCSIGNNYSIKGLCDPGASINLMPKSIFQKLGIREAKPTTVMLQLADRSRACPNHSWKTLLGNYQNFQKKKRSPIADKKKGQKEEDEKKPNQPAQDVCPGRHFGRYCITAVTQKQKNAADFLAENSWQSKPCANCVRSVSDSTIVTQQALNARQRLTVACPA